MIKNGDLNMSEKELLIEFYREFISSIIHTGDLELFLETMSDEISLMLPRANEMIH